MTGTTLCDAGLQKPIDVQSRIVSLVVGEHDEETGTLTQTFQVHEYVLQYSSIFFRAALSKRWAEGKDGTIRLPNVSPDILRIYLHYVYRGALPELVDTTKLQAGVHESVIAYPLLARLHVLAEFVQDTRFKTTILHDFIDCVDCSDLDGTRWLPTREAVNIIVEGTPQGSPARHLMVAIQVARGPSPWLNGDLDGLNKEFLRELAMTLYKWKDDYDESSASEWKAAYTHLIQKEGPQEALGL